MLCLFLLTEFLMHTKKYISLYFFMFFLCFQSLESKSSFLKFFKTWTKFNRDNRAFFSKTDTGTALESRTRQDNNKRLTFADIRGGIPQEIQDLYEFIKGSRAFQEVGAQIPKGFLLVGPPGTGKTSLVKALAGELEIPFITASGSEFVEIYVGAGPKKIRELFQNARDLSVKNNASYVIVFIDELDAIGSRDANHSNQEYKNTINQLLVEMDGFNQASKIIVIGATNHASAIDEALKRPGRFDYIVTIKLPDYAARLDILYYYLTDPLFQRSVSDDIDYATLAKKTVGFSGADIKKLANQAAIHAGRNKRTFICQMDLDEALATF